MREAAAVTVSRQRALRVFLSTEDAARCGAWAAIIVAAGHERAASSDDADLVLSDAGPGGEWLRISAHGGEQDPAGLLAADADAQQVEAALRAVAAGLVVRTPRAAEPGFHAIDEGEGRKLLTPRELEVLRAIGEGLTNKAIARRLGISLHTVKFHIESIFRKLGVRTRTGAIAKAPEWRGQTIEL